MSKEEMNKIIKGKTHFYENDTLTTGIINNDRITISNCVYYETPLLERIERLQIENNKLKQDNQELIEWVKEKIKNCNPNPQLYFNAQDEIKRHLYGEILEKLGE